MHNSSVVSVTYPPNITETLNPIARWDCPTLKENIVLCKKQARFYRAMAMASRVAAVVFGLSAMAFLGMRNPFYFPITLGLLMVAYHPFMSNTSHLFNAWAQKALREVGKYERILVKLNGDVGDVDFEISDDPPLLKRVLSAHYLVLEALLHDLQEPPAALREPLIGKAIPRAVEQKIRGCVRKFECLRILVEQAFVTHVAKHPRELPTLAKRVDFLTLPYDQLACLDAPIVVLKAGERHITDHMLQGQSPTQIAEMLFRAAV